MSQLPMPSGLWTTKEKQETTAEFLEECRQAMRKVAQAADTGDLSPEDLKLLVRAVLDLGMTVHSLHERLCDTEDLNEIMLEDELN